MPRRLLSAAAAGALLLGLAACGDPNDGPVTTPPPDIGIEAPSDGGGDTDPSDGGGEETESPTAAAPDIPPPDPADYAGMDENTPEGAEQAFRYYIAVLTWSRQSGNVKPLEKLQSRDCALCSELTADVTAHANEGQLWEDVTIEDTGTENFDSTNYQLEVGYVFNLSEHLAPDSSGMTPAQEWTGVAGMTWSASGWVIEELALEETGDEA